MSFTKSRVLLPALLGSLLLTSFGAVPSNADDGYAVNAASSDASQKCIDTSAQKKFNDELDSERIVMPMAKGSYALTSPYGQRTSPINGVTEVHTGSDFAAPDRSPILAVASGVVTASGPSSYGGQWVIIRHEIKGKVFDSVYIHLTTGSQLVKVGDKVTAGQHIADEGSTGLSTGPHLHLEIWENGFRGIMGFDALPGEKGHHINALEWLKSNNAVHISETPEYKSLECAFGEISKTANVAWGGYKNGEIPSTELKSLSFKPGVSVEKTAAEKLEGLNIAFKKKFGQDIPLIKGYENLESQKSGTSTAVPGKSFFGWGKSINLKFTNASNPYIPLVSEPDYFTDEEYKWMNEQGKEFGWINPAANQKNGENPDPGMWVYSPYAKDTNAKALFNKYALVNAMTHQWNSPENRQCMMDLWSQDGGWDNAYNKNGEMGISKLTADQVKKYNADIENYKKSPNTQVSVGLDYISDTYGNPCGALKTWKEKGSY